MKASVDVVTPDSGAPLFTDTARPLEVTGRGFTLLLERTGDSGLVSGLQVRGPTGDIQYAERFEPPLVAGEHLATQAIRAYELRTDRGRGAVLYYREPPRTGLSASMRVLALHAGRLHAIGPRLGVHGRFAPLVESGDPAVLYLLPGDRFDVEVRHDHFTIVVPYRVRLSGCTPAAQPCVREGVRRGDIVPGLSLLPVVAERREITRDTSVLLHDAPEGRSPVRVAMSPGTQIAIIEVAAEVYTEPQGAVSVIRTRREWLRVRIDAREGWLAGAASFGAIGLPAR